MSGASMPLRWGRLRASRAVLGLLVGALAATAWPHGAAAQAPGDDGAIVFSVFTRSEPSDADLWRIDPDGGGLAQLTTGPGVDRSPAWSPDGSRIAFIRGAGGGELWTMSADGSDQRRLTDGTSRDFDPSWSPDGARLVFARAGPELGSDLWTIGADGSGAESLLDLPPFQPATQPDWSPDGSEVAFLGPGGLEAVTVATGERRVIAPDQPGAGLDWAPDGTRLVYTRDTPCPSIDVFAVPRAGGEPVQLTDFCGGSLSWPAFSPDGSRLAVVHLSGGREEVIADLGIVDATGTAPTTAIDKLTDDTTVAGRADQPDWGRPALNAPPSCDGLTVDRPRLRRRHHRFVRVHVGGVSDPDGDPVELAVEAVTQDEPVGWVHDARLVRVEPAAADLRAESARRGDGRVYRLGVAASDPSGATCRGTVPVAVPRRPGVPAVDSAPPSYDSLSPGWRPL